VTFINKSDQKDLWNMNPSMIADLKQKSLAVFETSAKNGVGIDEGFESMMSYLF